MMCTSPHHQRKETNMQTSKSNVNIQCQHCALWVILTNIIIFSMSFLHIYWKQTRFLHHRIDGLVGCTSGEYRVHITLTLLTPGMHNPSKKTFCIYAAPNPEHLIWYITTPMTRNHHDVAVQVISIRSSHLLRLPQHRPHSESRSEQDWHHTTLV